MECIVTIARRSAPLVLALLASAGAFAQPAPAAGERSPPSPHCLDARGVRQVEQASPAAIAVLGANGQAYRLEFTDACPGVNEAEQVRLDAPDGWACGSPGERLVVDGRTCAVAGVGLMDNRSFAEAARESSRQYAATLPTVNVTARSARSNRAQAFQGSPEFCFATRNVRGWSEDPKGVVVETNPKKNGGHRYYHLELGSSCSILEGATAVDFQSGFQNGLICGNPGDRIVMADNGLVNDGEGGDQRAHTPRFARPGCSVLAVYPRE
ncbi:MAG: hypothetical protein K0S73_1618 [Stenotrophomonas rhizophila]|jgi:hypothetical protein|nr:hypothetical protein [Stenotrophomonas rhizophila]